MVGTTINDRFRIDKELGQGGMGAVYRATDLILGRTVAIKILKDLGGEEVGRKIRLEAQILARLLHDNIVRLYDFGVSERLHFLVMEEVDGTSYLRRSRKLALAERLGVLAQVSDALDYAHHQGVIHRDIKPANVLLTATDQAKLSDFGLSMLVEEAQETGTTRGTPHYMSPEQAKGKKLDHRTDLYSIGVMLYESATGVPPFQGDALSVMAQQVRSDPEPPRTRNPEISVELEGLILRLMAKEPEARPVSGREAARMIRDLVAAGLYHAPTIGGATVSVPGVPSITAPSPVPEASVQARPPTAVTISASRPSLAWTGPRRDPEEARRVRAMVDRVEAEPIALNPDERYLSGHYLAYLLGGSRRKGFFLRRPLDPLNADRARLLLGMTSIMIAGGDDAAIEEAARLLDRRHDVRPALSPVVVVKYLASRSTPARRKAFRQVRERLREASAFAKDQMLDARGNLNPGLMPQVLADLQRVAPPRTEVDDRLVARWNRVTEVWRDDPAFRDNVLGYATTSAASDPESAGLWPEVVYPLIERARWQRKLRSGGEVFWDAVSQGLQRPDPGIRLDRAFSVKVPRQVVEELEAEIVAFDDRDPELLGDLVAPPSDPESRASATFTVGSHSFEDVGPSVEEGPQDVVRLTSPDPVRLTHGELRGMYLEAVKALRDRQPSGGLRSVPIGPYRLVVVPSVRSRAAGQVAIQGMPNKQIELNIPPFVGGTTASKPVVACWIYRDNSLAVAYADFKGNDRYVLWNAPVGQQSNYETAADLNHAAFGLRLEAPDQLTQALTKKFRPRDPV